MHTKKRIVIAVVTIAALAAVCVFAFREFVAPDESPRVLAEAPATMDDYERRCAELGGTLVSKMGGMGVGINLHCLSRSARAADAGEPCSYDDDCDGRNGVCVGGNQSDVDVGPIGRCAEHAAIMKWKSY